MLSSSWRIIPHLRILNSLKPNGAVMRNYWSRRNTFPEFSSAIRAVEDCVRDLDKEMTRIFGDMRRSGGPMRTASFCSPFDLGRTRDVPVVSEDENSRTYKLEIDLQGMRPEDITVTLKNNFITIKARREEKKDDGTHAIKELSYCYDLPEDVNPETIRSLFKNGVLTIDAPLPAVESKEIPINVETSDKSDTSTKQ